MTDRIDTNAEVLATKLDSLSQRLDGYFRDLTKAIEAIVSTSKDHDSRLRALEIENARLQSSILELRQRLILITGGLATGVSVLLQGVGYLLK